jgi:hypothetical protein
VTATHDQIASSDNGRSKYRRSRNTFISVCTAAAIVALLAGCSSPFAHTVAHAKHTHHAQAPATKHPTASPTPTDSPNPTSASFPSPTINPIPAGTVVASGDVASPKGSIHFHYAMVSNGDDGYIAQYSGFTSTVPVPISVTLLTAAPRVGDGLSYHGVGDHQLGGPTTTALASSVFIANGPPSSLGTLVRDIRGRYSGRAGAE